MVLCIYCAFFFAQFFYILKNSTKKQHNNKATHPEPRIDSVGVDSGMNWNFNWENIQTGGQTKWRSYRRWRCGASVDDSLKPQGQKPRERLRGSSCQIVLRVKIHEPLHETHLECRGDTCAHMQRHRFFFCLRADNHVNELTTGKRKVVWSKAKVCGSLVCRGETAEH